MICLPGKVIVIITIPTTSIGRVESKFPTLGYPRSNNTTAGQWGPMREHYPTTVMIMRNEMHQ